MMNFNWTETQKSLKENAIKFAKSNNPSDMIEIDKNGTFSKQHWLKYAEFGVQGLTAPENLGGSGLDLLSCIAVMEGLGYGALDHGMLFSISAHIWSFLEPLLVFGSEKQKDNYFPGLCNGNIIGVHAMTEPEAGSDAFSMRTRANDEGDHYLINGSKTFITNGNVADSIIVFTNIIKKNGDKKLSCIIVDKGKAGFSCSSSIEKMGLRTSPFCELFFTDCIVPKDNLLGSEGQGQQIFNCAMEGERTFIFATQIGRMEKQIENCLDYARIRKQFGKSIIKFQSISNYLAEMKVNLETSRLLAYKVGWLKANNKNAFQFSSIAKLHISECAVKNSLLAMKIHGGYGYTTEFEFERHMRDSIGGLFYSGTSEIMRNIITELLD